MQLSTLLKGAGFMAAGIAVSAVPLWLRYRRDIAAAVERVNNGSRVISTTSGLIEYAETGSGLPFLCIHGTGGGFDQGLMLARRMGVDPSQFRIIAPSRFGYLGTPIQNADTTPAGEADAHASLLDALDITGPAVVAGVSAGALSALQFAIRYPARVRALLLMVPDSWMNGPAAKGQQIGGNRFIAEEVFCSDFFLWAALRMARGKMLSFLGVPKSLQHSLTPGDEQSIRETLEGMLPVSRRFQGIMKEVANHAVLQPYPVEQISAPTLIIDAADVATFTGSTYMAGRIPNARLVQFPSGGHLLIGRQDEVQSAVHTFLAELKR
jgi:2-hydroxy-6-oxonona-2,4-dienedioate hydrolase